MISYHPVKDMPNAFYSKGFKAVDTVELPRLSKCMTSFVWSPCIWDLGRRSQQTFKSAVFCGLDFDNGEMSLAEAIQSFCDMRCVIGTTTHHQIPKHKHPAYDRFRVVLQWERPITDLRIYRWNMHKVFEVYPTDKSGIDGARFFRPCKEIVFINNEPDALFASIDTEVPETFEPVFRVPEMHKKYKIVPGRYYRQFEKNYKSGQRNVIAFGFSKDLAKIGMSELEIIETISKHPAYQREPLPLQELHNTVRSALRSLAGP